MNYKVYIHRFPNNKVYVGVTMQSISKRWQGGMGYRENIRMFRAIVKYGWDNIKHEVLYENISEDDAYEIEKKLVKEYKSNKYQFGYNRACGGRYSNEGTHFENRKVKKIKRRPKGDNAPQAKAICQYDLDGKLIKVWGSGVSISKALNKPNASGISSSCTGKQLSAYGFIWLYEDSGITIEERLKAIDEHNKKRKGPKLNKRTAKELSMSISDGVNKAINSI